MRAYEIADAFRQRGVKVVIGGPHTFFESEEAAEHCDAVGMGEGEYIWPAMLKDAAAARLKKIYRQEPIGHLAGLPLPRYDLVDLRRYGPFKTFCVVASRGCPFQCEFCLERFLLGKQYRWRPVPEVIQEIKWCGSRNILFGDSNFAGKRSHSMELMQALAPLKLRWSALFPAHICCDDEFMDLAARSGLLHVNIGIESIEPQTLEGMHKRFNKTHQYSSMLAGLHRRRISYSLNFIFGWDGESGEVFDSTLNFLEQHKVPVAYFNILMPEKGTPLYERMKSAGRIINPQEISRWPGQICSILPTNGTPEQMEARTQSMYSQFYSLRSIFRRLPLRLSRANIASWVINLSQRRMARAELQDQSLANNFDSY
jgi:radical SAM superfamily enzyme YgiQ (UPF0313 family)